MKKKCENKKENEKNCPCSEKDCKNHGICCQCVAYHRKDGSKPACMR